MLSSRADVRRLLEPLKAAWEVETGGRGPARRGERSHARESHAAALARVMGEVLRGHTRPGDAFPSERELAPLLGVSRTTLRHALEQLVGRGALERVPGLGTFVPRPQLPATRGLPSFSEDMRARGMVPDARVLRFESTVATGWLAREMGLDLGAPVVYLQRLLRADGEAIAVDENYLPAQRLPGLAKERAPRALYEFLRERYGVVPDTGEDQIEAIGASVVQARLLGIGAGEPLLQVVRHAYAARELINYSACFYRADRYRLSMPLHRA